MLSSLSSWIDDSHPTAAKHKLTYEYQTSHESKKELYQKPPKKILFGLCPIQIWSDGMYIYICQLSTDEDTFLKCVSLNHEIVIDFLQRNCVA